MWLRFAGWEHNSDSQSAIKQCVIQQRTCHQAAKQSASKVPNRQDQNDKTKQKQKQTNKQTEPGLPARVKTSSIRLLHTDPEAYGIQWSESNKTASDWNTKLLLGIKDIYFLTWRRLDEENQEKKARNERVCRLTPLHLVSARLSNAWPGGDGVSG